MKGLTPARDGEKPSYRGSFKIYEELYDRVLKFCGEQERSVNWLAVKAIEEFLTKRGY